MKKVSYILIGLASIMSACNNASSSLLGDKKIETAEDSLSYSFGQLFAKQVGQDTMLLNAINSEVFIKGVYDVLENNQAALTDKQVEEVIGNFVKVVRAKMEAQQEGYLKSIKEEGEHFLEENKTKAGVVELESGIQYKMLVSGNGKSPKASGKIKIAYEGSTIDGQVFDASPEGSPRTFDLGNLISGWKKVLPLMKEGDKWEIYLPYNEAYGERGAGDDIPPYSTLIFVIELIEVVE